MTEFNYHVAQPVSVVQKEIVIWERDALFIPVGATPDPFIIFTEFGRVMPDVKTKPNVLSPYLPMIANSKLLEFYFYIDDQPNFRLDITIRESTAPAGALQKIRRRIISQRREIEFTHQAIDNVVFLYLTNNSPLPIPDGLLKIVSRPE